MKQQDDLDLEEIRSILDELRTSLGKIKEHGKRADNIVRSMLEHSRSKEGEWRKTNLNALLKQYVELSYHALRAEDNSFNADMKEDLDPNMEEIVVVPQDICRVFLNLVNNAFQAMNEKQKRWTVTICRYCPSPAGSWRITWNSASGTMVPASRMRYVTKFLSRL